MQDHDPESKACLLCFCPSWTLLVRRTAKAAAWTQPRVYERRPGVVP